jgi:hypothetical protein
MTALSTCASCWSVRQTECRARPTNGSQLGLGFSLPVLKSPRHHLAQYRALVAGRAAPSLLSAIRGIISDLLRGNLSLLSTEVGGQSRDENPREFIVQHIVGASMAVLTWWLDRRGQAAAGDDGCNVP